MIKVLILHRQVEIDGQTMEAQTFVFFSFSFKTFLALELEMGLINLKKSHVRM